MFPLKNLNLNVDICEGEISQISNFTTIGGSKNNNKIVVVFSKKLTDKLTEI